MKLYNFNESHRAKWILSLLLYLESKSRTYETRTCTDGIQRWQRNLAVSRIESLNIEGSVAQDGMNFIDSTRSSNSATESIVEKQSRWTRSDKLCGSCSVPSGNGWKRKFLNQEDGRTCFANGKTGKREESVDKPRRLCVVSPTTTGYMKKYIHILEQCTRDIFHFSSLSSMFLSLVHFLQSLLWRSFATLRTFHSCVRLLIRRINNLHLASRCLRVTRDGVAARV